LVKPVKIITFVLSVNINTIAVPVAKTPVKIRVSALMRTYDVGEQDNPY
jgi:hypothetical protein